MMDSTRPSIVFLLGFILLHPTNFNELPPASAPPAPEAAATTIIVLTSAIHAFGVLISAAFSPSSSSHSHHLFRHPLSPHASPTERPPQISGSYPCWKSSGRLFRWRSRWSCLSGERESFRYRPCAAAARRHGNIRHRQAMDVENPATPKGRREINTLHVPARPPGEALDSDQPGRHSRFLAIPAFRTKQDVLPRHLLHHRMVCTPPATRANITSSAINTAVDVAKHAEMVGTVIVLRAG